MRVLLGVCLLVTLATLATSRKLWSMRTTPLVAVLSSGGWFSFFLGLLLGPKGMAVLRYEELYTLKHIAFFFLGWVGLNIGLQIRPGIILSLSREVVLTGLWDAFVTLFLLSMCYFAVVYGALLPGDRDSSLFIALLLGVCSLGWLGEMRSLRMCGLGGRGKLRLYFGATSGFSSILAVLSFGVLLEVYALGTPQLMGWQRPGGPAFGISVAAVLAILVGVLAKFLLRLAGSSRSDYLVVLFGLVALPAAFGIAMGISPMFLSMLSGAAISNLARRESIRLQSLLLEGERLIATGLMLFAGMAANPDIGVAGAVLILSVLSGRGAFKWLSVFVPSIRSVSDLSLVHRYVGAARQSYLGPIFVLSLCNIAGTLVLPVPLGFEKLLTVVAIAGLLSHLLPAVALMTTQNRRAAAP